MLINSDRILLTRQIAKKLSCSKQKIYYYTTVLRKKGYIEKKGYGVWEVKKLTLNILDFDTSKSIRGHAFIWTIKIPKEMKERVEESRKKYKLVRKTTPRLIINGKKVWVGKKSIVVFENKSFYAKDSTNARKYADQKQSILICNQK